MKGMCICCGLSVITQFRSEIGRTAGRRRVLEVCWQKSVTRFVKKSVEARLSGVWSWPSRIWVRTGPTLQVRLSGPVRGWTGPNFEGPGPGGEWTGPWGRTQVGPEPDLNFTLWICLIFISLQYTFTVIFKKWRSLKLFITRSASDNHAATTTMQPQDDDDDGMWGMTRRKGPGVYTYLGLAARRAGMMESGLNYASGVVWATGMSLFKFCFFCLLTDIFCYI